MLKQIQILTACLFAFGTADAAVVHGNYLGTFAGNDSATAMTALLGVEMLMLTRIESPAHFHDDFKISDVSFNDDGEAIAGQWSYVGTGVIDYIVIKAGPQFAVYRYTDLTISGTSNTGLWDTSGVENKGLSHITAYSANAVPLPAAVWLLGSAVMGLVATRRRR